MFAFSFQCIGVPQITRISLKAMCVECNCFVSYFFTYNVETKRFQAITINLL